jgi:hypothetical protein
MTTIRRNWTNRVAEIRSAARFCRAYDSATGNMVPVDPARAFEAWESTPRARLTEDTPGQKWTVHVHSNRFYKLTAEDPSAPQTDATPTDEASTAVPAARPGDPRPDAGPAGTQDHGAALARALARHSRTSGPLGRGRMPRQLPARAVELVGKTVRVKLAQGYSHEQIRDEFEHQRAEAETAGDTGRATALATMLTVHGAMTTEEATAQSPTGPTAANHGHSSPDEQRLTRQHPNSPRDEEASGDDVLSRIDSVLHDAAVTEDPTVSDDAMRSAPWPTRTKSSTPTHAPRPSRTAFSSPPTPTWPVMPGSVSRSPSPAPRGRTAWPGTTATATGRCRRTSEAASGTSCSPPVRPSGAPAEATARSTSTSGACRATAAPGRPAQSNSRVRSGQATTASP